jgi:hypothetical protein
MSDMLILDNATTIYCHQISRVEKLGPNRLLIFTIPSINDPGFHEVTVKLILPAEAMDKLAHLAIDTDATVSRELIALVPRVAN